MTRTTKVWSSWVRGLIAPLLCLALLAGPAAAQTIPHPQGFPVSSQHDRVLDFAVANSVFILRHEIGHLLINEFQLPVLGREEDAADILATLWLLRENTDEARLVLSDAIGGWFLSARGVARKGYQNADYYDVHALDIQRSFNILCLSVGQNRSAFFRIAEQMGLGAQRRSTCRFDFRTAEKGWDRLLEPHLRAADEPRQNIAIIYEDANPSHVEIAAAMQKARVLEDAADHLTERYRLPRELKFRAANCHDENAYFDAQAGSILFCYEVAGYFGGLMSAGAAEPDQAMREQSGGETRAIMPAGARPSPAP